MKKNNFTAIGSLLLVLVVALTCTSFRPFNKICPTLQLSSPPSNVIVVPTVNSSCVCSNCHGCTNTFTITSYDSSCGPYTFYFSNSTTGWTCSVIATSNTVTVWLQGSVGDSLSCYFTNSAGTSPSYNFTGVACP